MSGKLFIFGLGFSGQAIARAALDMGWAVSGSTRSGDGGRNAEIRRHVFDRDHPLDADALDGVTHVLSAVPPDAHGDPVLDLNLTRLRELAPRWVGYLSTTGVYGDHGGAWVNEKTAATPNLDRSRRRLAAEQAWTASDLPVHIFRLAGIYGPGRSALDSVRDGSARRIAKPGQVFSRIHVDDIAQTILASIARPNAGAIYNVCDDDPAPPEDVIAHAAQLLGRPIPPVLDWDQAVHSLSPMALSFYADNKRVDNGRIKRELGIVLRYPSYRQGLAAMLGIDPP